MGTLKDHLRYNILLAGGVAAVVSDPVLSLLGSYSLIRNLADRVASHGKSALIFLLLILALHSSLNGCYKNNHPSDSCPRLILLVFFFKFVFGSAFKPK